MTEATEADTMTFAELTSRLRELGYYDGPLEGRPWHSTIEALARFQRLNGLPITRRPDQATSEALRSSYCY